MGKIVELAAHRPHETGEAFCQNCLYPWVAVAPLNVHKLECPKCGELTGVLSGADGSQYGIADYLVNKHFAKANAMQRMVLTDDIVQAMKQWANRTPLATPTEGGE